ncbi:MAG: rhodanese-related sulfurtransferase [Planctomycetota bacterium]|jgi:rhodanese-related sulfurtransferase
MNGSRDKQSRDKLNIMIKEITPLEAWEILQSNSNSVLLDVRSYMEYAYVGHPPEAVFVSLKEPPGWENDPAFVANVTKSLQEKRPDRDPQDLTILALCRSGARSMAAAEELTNSGFKEVVNVAEGFEGDKDENNHRNTINGWRFHGLPWEQS